MYTSCILYLVKNKNNVKLLRKEHDSCFGEYGVVLVNNTLHNNCAAFKIRHVLLQIMPNHLNMVITKILGALLVASGPLNFHQDWTKND